MIKNSLIFHPRRSNRNVNLPVRNFGRKLTRRIAVWIIISLLLVFVYIWKVEDHLPSTERNKYAPVNSSFTFIKNYQTISPILQYNNMSTDDVKLYDTLIDRAKKRSNRYYLNDFAYFRMIQNEFPQSESATRLGRGSGLLPLLPTTLNSQDVLFIVMGSVANINRSKLLVETWLQWSQGNFFIFADANDSSVPFMTLPQLLNKPEYTDAQHRQFIGSQWLIYNKFELVKRTKWFVFVDDDTWVNVPALLSYLQFFDHRLLLSIGYIWDKPRWMSQWSYLSGGAGIVFSQSAFIVTISAIYTIECPFIDMNDVTIMNCQKQKGVTKIHSDRFDWTEPSFVPSLKRVPAVHYIGKLTFHYMNKTKLFKRITCDVAEHWNQPINGCSRLNLESVF